MYEKEREMLTVESKERNCMEKKRMGWVRERTRGGIQENSRKKGREGK